MLLASPKLSWWGGWAEDKWTRRGKHFSTACRKLKEGRGVNESYSSVLVGEGKGEKWDGKKISQERERERWWWW